MTKDEVLKALDDSRHEFLTVIDGLTEAQLQEPGVNGDWSIKDIMYHVSLWEAELVTLLWQASNGGIPTSVHFTQSDINQTNLQWFLQGKFRQLEAVRLDFEGVRKQTKRRIRDFSDKDLNNPQRFIWQHGDPLWEWIGSNSFQHKREHTAQILAWRKQRGY